MSSENISYVHTECSSCLTSCTVPSLKVHFTTNASGDVPLTCSLFSSLAQNLSNSWSLMRCQTAERGAWMTVDSVTELEVGIMLVMMDNLVEMILQKLNV